MTPKRISNSIKIWSHTKQLVYDFSIYSDLEKFRNFLKVFEKFGLLNHNYMNYYTDPDLLQVVFDGEPEDVLVF